MIWVAIIAILIYIFYKFSLDVNKDKVDIKGQSLSEKFKVVVDSLNRSVFNGNAKITTLNDRYFNLYQEGGNKIIDFFYGTGHLTITWKYKFFQKEVIYEKIFHDVRNITALEQEKMAEIVLREGTAVIHNHEKNVTSGIAR